MVAVAEEPYPGQRLGLPETGRGSLCPWNHRIAALVMDWLFCSLLALVVVGQPAPGEFAWRAVVTHASFFVESAVLTWLYGGSLGQLICGVAVVRLGLRRLGFGRSVARALLVSLTLPPLIIGADRRGLQDLAVDSVVVRRR